MEAHHETLPTYRFRGFGYKPNIVEKIQEKEIPAGGQWRCDPTHCPLCLETQRRLK